jgi:hypothetical protein
MAGIVPLNPSCPLQHIQLIVPDRMSGVPINAFQEITIEQVLDQVVTPINNRPPILQDKYPLAIDR